MEVGESTKPVQVCYWWHAEAVMVRLQQKRS
jgi:hypothetical protein